jgi:SnoaL-like polyketide cyclase
VRRTPAEAVSEFFRVVPSGERPDRAAEYLAPTVLAHQVRSDSPETIHRNLEGYAEHVRDMVAMFGPFSLTIEEFMAGGDKVFVRWTQHGWHRATIDGFPATGPPARDRRECRVSGGGRHDHRMDAAGRRGPHGPAPAEPDRRVTTAH